jgi:hypothetical protein
MREDTLGTRCALFQPFLTRSSPAAQATGQIFGGDRCHDHSNSVSGKDPVDAHIFNIDVKHVGKEVRLI